MKFTMPLKMRRCYLQSWLVNGISWDGDFFIYSWVYQYLPMSTTYPQDSTSHLIGWAPARSPSNCLVPSFWTGARWRAPSQWNGPTWGPWGCDRKNDGLRDNLQGNYMITMITMILLYSLNSPFRKFLWIFPSTKSGWVVSTLTCLITN